MLQSIKPPGLYIDRYYSWLTHKLFVLDFFHIWSCIFEIITSDASFTTLKFVPLCLCHRHHHHDAMYTQKNNLLFKILLCCLE